jgi:hypothetical protein
MSLLKNCVADNRLHASRNKSRPALRPVRQADGANSSKIRPDGQSASRLAFVEDFTWEHSFRGLHFTSIEISGNF